MLNQEKVFKTLRDNGVTYFTGVPDSYLNGFCNYALANCGERNIIAANEGNAVYRNNILVQSCQVQRIEVDAEIIVRHYDIGCSGFGV